MLWPKYYVHLDMKIELQRELLQSVVSNFYNYYVNRLPWVFLHIFSILTSVNEKWTPLDIWGHTR